MDVGRRRDGKSECPDASELIFCTYYDRTLGGVMRFFVGKKFIFMVKIQENVLSTGSLWGVKNADGSATQERSSGYVEQATL